MKKLDDRAKKLLVIFGGVIGLIILIILIVFIVSLFKNNSMSYSQIEDKLVEASKSYFASKNDLLPLNDNDEVQVSSDELVNAGYMKELSKYVKDESVTCSGSVLVTKSGDYFNYSPYLDCGDRYITKYLYEKLRENVVFSGEGLYKTTQFYKGTSDKIFYIYRGEHVNNFIKFGEDIWRIVKITPDFNIMIIKNDVSKKIEYNGVWDNRYNIHSNRKDGINDYNKSIIRYNLMEYYNNIFIDDKLKEKNVIFDFCVGTRKQSEINNSGTVECSIIDSNYVGLLPVYDYINASLDLNCKKTIDNSCSNYNYLNFDGITYWLATSDKEHTNYGFECSSSIISNRLSAKAYGRPVVFLSKNLVYLSGSGSLDDPYVVK